MLLKQLPGVTVLPQSGHSASSNLTRSCTEPTRPPGMAWVSHSTCCSSRYLCLGSCVSPLRGPAAPGTASACSCPFFTQICSLSPSPGYTCICPGLFSGEHCELGDSPCESKPCLHGGTCTLSATGYSCHCPDWYLGER